jgi:hypothetical protein
MALLHFDSWDYSEYLVLNVTRMHHTLTQYTHLGQATSSYLPLYYDQSKNKVLNYSKCLRTSPPLTCRPSFGDRNEFH